MIKLQCQRCFRALTECQTCKGKGCNRCTDGLVCPEHGKFWKK